MADIEELEDFSLEGMARHREWLLMQHETIPDAGREAFYDLLMLPPEQQGGLARFIRLHARSEGGHPLGLALQNMASTIKAEKEGYLDRCARARELGIPESRYREGIDENGNDVAFQRELGGLD